MSVDTVRAAATDNGALRVLYQAEDRRVDRVMFADEAAAALGLTGTATRLVIDDAVYVYDAAGADFTTGDGRRWTLSERKRAQVAHPNPVYQRFRNEGMDLDVNKIGLIPSGSTTHGGHNADVLNGLSEEAAARTGGLCITGALVSEDYENPEIVVTEPIIQRDGLSFNFADLTTRIRAGASMASLLMTPDDASRINYTQLIGGNWDGAGLCTDSVIYWRNPKAGRLGGNGMRIDGATRYGLKIGDPANTDGGEPRISDLYIRHLLDVTHDEDSCGIYFAAAMNDAHFSDIIVNGFKTGVGADLDSFVGLYHTRWSQVHCWSSALGQGSMDYGWNLGPSRHNTFVACQAGSPQVAGWKMKGYLNHWSACTAHQLGDAAPDQTAWVVDLTDASGPCIVEGFVVDEFDTRFKGLVKGSILLHRIRNNVMSQTAPPEVENGMRVDRKKGSWTVEFSDASGHTSTTTRGGAWRQDGDRVECRVKYVGDIARPVDVVLSDPVRMSLPFAAVSFNEEVGEWVPLAGVDWGLGTVPFVFIGNSETHVEFRFARDDGNFVSLTWADIEDGVADIQAIKFEYEIALDDPNDD